MYMYQKLKHFSHKSFVFSPHRHTCTCRHTYIRPFPHAYVHLCVIYRVCGSGFIKAMISHKMSAMVVNMTRGGCVSVSAPSVAAES